MTPREKAKELVEKFIPFSFCGEDLLEEDQDELSFENAKKCAIICVEEIDKAIDFDWMGVQNLDREHNYWNQVRSEILIIANT